MRRKLRIRRVSLSSILKFSAVLGAVLSVVPSILLSWTAGVIVGTVRDFLQPLNRVEVANILGQSISIDLIQQLQLMGLRDAVVAVDDRWTQLQPLLALILVGSGIVGWVTVGIVAGLLYNILSIISGGLLIEVEAQDIPAAPAELPPAFKRDTLLS